MLAPAGIGVAELDNVGAVGSVVVTPVTKPDPFVLMVVVCARLTVVIKAANSAAAAFMCMICPCITAFDLLEHVDKLKYLPEIWLR